MFHFKAIIQEKWLDLQKAVANFTLINLQKMWYFYNILHVLSIPYALCNPPPTVKKLFELFILPAQVVQKCTTFFSIYFLVFSVFFCLCRPSEANLQLHCQPCRPTNQELTCSCRLGDAGSEPGTVILQPGALPLSNHTPYYVQNYQAKTFGAPKVLSCPFSRHFLLNCEVLSTEVWPMPFLGSAKRFCQEILYIHA